MFYLVTKVKFICWLFRSVNHTSMSWNSELNVFKKNDSLKFLINYQTVYLERACTRLLNLVDNYY